jgi:hypothetical protein
MSPLKKVLLGAALLLLLVVAAFVVWVGRPYQATEVAEAAFARAEQAPSGAWYAFYPPEQEEPPEVGVILYPGGLVEAEAYAVLAERLAEAGQVLVVVKRMPLNLAILNTDGADEVIAAFPEVEQWVVGGHSLGGSAAAIFADENPRVAGLLLWASYPPDNNDLSDDPLRVVSLYGSEDGVLNRDALDASRVRLPANTLFTELEGVNHAFFGDYGAQQGDGEPGVSREIGQAAILEASVQLLNGMRDRAVAKSRNAQNSIK